jgi:phosphate transport system permease protein
MLVSLGIILCISVIAFLLGKAKAEKLVERTGGALRALPPTFGWFTALLTFGFSLFTFFIFIGLLKNNASATSLYVATTLAGVLGIIAGMYCITPRFNARRYVEGMIKITLLVSSLLAVLTTLGIVLSLIFESIRFFGKVPMSEFLFGLNWSPQTAIRADQVGSTGAFGAVPLFTGTLLITFIAISIAAPIGLMSAIYMSDYASNRARAIVKPLLELLAGVPTVVYGFFAIVTIAPLIRNIATDWGFSVASESALAAGFAMGIMIIPFVSSLSDDIIRAVPQRLRDGSFGLGATKYETVRFVVLPAALPGLVSALLLAISRAIGETMIVVMAAGMAANLTLNPLEAVTTVTVQIVSLLVGDQEFDSPKTLAAFALGLTLLFITLIFNIIAMWFVRRYREKYD